MVRTGDAYSGKGLLYAQRLTSGINYAMRKVARERLAPRATESITLDEYGIYDTNGLGNRCLRIRSLTYATERKVIWKDFTEDKIQVEGYEGETLEAVYEYLPLDMDLDTELDVELRIDDKNVDGLCLCQYANYQFLSEEGTEYDSSRAQVWLGLFTDSFNEIEDITNRPRTVRWNG